MNNYIELLPHDFIEIKDPITEKKVKLYRVIATKTFKTKPRPIQPEYTKTTEVIIERYDVGGYIESLDNIDQSEPIWINHNAKVWGNSKVKSSLIEGNAIVFGNSIVTNSYLSDWAVVQDKAEVMNSIIVNGATIKGSAKITNSNFLNSAMAMNASIVEDSMITGGSYVFNNAVVRKCILDHYSCIGGNSNCINVHLKNRASVVNKSLSNTVLDEDEKLNLVNPITKDEKLPVM